MKAYAVYDDLFHEKFSKFQLKRTYHAQWCTCSITTKQVISSLERINVLTSHSVAIEEKEEKVN